MLRIEIYSKERISIIEEENEQLKLLMLEHLSEIADLRNQICFLQKELKNKKS